jgi:hypothetical protein
MPEYIWPNIRALLKNALSDDDLDEFCFDYFRSVHQSFTAGMSRVRKIQLLIEHSRSRASIDTLLAHVQEVNPAMYARHQPYIASPLPQLEDEQLPSGARPTPNENLREKWLTRIGQALKVPTYQSSIIIWVLLAVALIIIWFFWSNVSTLLFSRSIPVNNLTDTSVRFTVTHKDHSEQEFPPAGILTLLPGDGVVIEVNVAIDRPPSPSTFTYEYFAPKGNIATGSSSTPMASYVAPERPVSDVITVLITDQQTDNQILRSLNVVVRGNSP